MQVSQMVPPPGSKAVIVGGCGGIGLSFANFLCSVGAKVAVIDLPRSFETTDLPDDVSRFPADASDPAALSAAIDAASQQLGGIDTLAYVSGIGVARTPVEELDLRDWQRVLDVNVTGAFLASKAAMPWLRQSGGGNILFVASGLYVQPDGGVAAYASSKGALVSLMKALASEGAPGVRANAVAPGLIETAFLTGGTGRGAAIGGSTAFEFPAAGDPRVLEKIPLGRLGKPDDVSGAMAFLASPAAAYITGQVLFVNGGRYAH